jgi:hypothetical protein
MPIQLAAARGDAGAQQETAEDNAFVEKRVALVDADHHRRLAFDIFALAKAGQASRLRALKASIPWAMALWLLCTEMTMPSFSIEDGYRRCGHSAEMKGHMA